MQQNVCTDLPHCCGGPESKTWVEMSFRSLLSSLRITFSWMMLTVSINCDRLAPLWDEKVECRWACWPSVWMLQLLMLMCWFRNFLLLFIYLHMNLNAVFVFNWQHHLSMSVVENKITDTQISHGTMNANGCDIYMLTKSLARKALDVSCADQWWRNTRNPEDYIAA